MSTSKINEINFFNPANNGDIFLSRIVLNQARKYSEKVNIYHNQPAGLFTDCCDISEFIGIPSDLNKSVFFDKNWFNLWIAADGGRFMKDGSCSYDSYKNMCNEFMRQIGCNTTMDDVSLYEALPAVDYEKLSNYLYIKDVMNNLKEKNEEIILICTGDVNSGQSKNFDFKDIVNSLSNDFKNKHFITTTQPIIIDEKNITYSGDITKIRPDLLEISFISTFCNTIVGRASGPSTFCMTKNNVFDKNKTFIGFSNKELDWKFVDEHNCKFIWSNNFEENSVYETIKKGLLK